MIALSILSSDGDNHFRQIVTFDWEEKAALTGKDWTFIVRPSTAKPV
jgi:hypothetical protein